MMAAAIKAAVRADDLVGRLGGEEFGVFLRGVDVETAAVIAERVRGAIEGLVVAPEGQLHPLSVSVGGVQFKGEAEFSDLFRIADQRLYGVKHTGRGRVDLADAVFAGPSLQMA
jgi:diguanylate cyclase (GGDEF)-like protein